MRRAIAILLSLAGLASVLGGVALIYVPAALILGGGLAVFIAVFAIGGVEK